MPPPKHPGVSVPAYEVVPSPRSGPLDWPTLLASALRGDGVGIHFQPIIDLVRGTVVGYEALARFDGYPVSDPMEWFAAAHLHGRGAELESLTLRQALTAREALPSGTFLAVNIGPDVIGHPEVERVWREQGSLDGVVIELTEHARIDSYVALTPILDRLRRAGALIALDDAGAGYAGLQHMVGIKPHLIKLDRQLISGIDDDETKRALVEMIGAFAVRIHAEVLAEGIEEDGELETLVSLGVTLAQGYLLARPALPWAELDVAASERLLLRRVPAPRDTLRLLVQETVVVRDLASAHAAFAEPELPTQNGASPVVLVDADSMPLAVIDAHGVRPLTNGQAPLTQDTTVARAARQAVERIPTQRFGPLLCVDDEGRFVGVVPMERVVGYLADAWPGEHALATAERRPDDAPTSRSTSRSTTGRDVLSHDSGSGGRVGA
jgi:EAL domain-containing protein (putative c-di-GMP-specific phosphodiesterase class I)